MTTIGRCGVGRSAVGARDTPLMTALRWVEWDYGKAGWHGDVDVAPALYSLHYRTPKRSSLEARRLPVLSLSWVNGPTSLLLHLRRYIEKWGTARFVTADDPQWCGLSLATEVWAVMEDVGWLDVAPRDNPMRFTARSIYGVLAEDLAVTVLHRDEGSEVVRGPVTTVGGDIAHALSLATSTVDYQWELDAEARRTGAPAH